MKMFKVNNKEQISLFDPINNLTNYQNKLLKKSWAYYFREKIFFQIDEEKFSVLYSDKPSRPNTPVNILVGLLIIKALTNLSDEELIEAFIFDFRFQYALHTTDKERQPISKNMFTNFRNALIDYEIRTGRDLIKEEIIRLSKQISECIKVDKTLSRMDSMMIESSSKRLSRIDLAYKVNINFIEKVNEIDEEKLEERFKEYLSPTYKQEKIYTVDKSNHQEILSQLLKDSKELCEKFKDEEKIANTQEYELLVRLVGDQIDSETKGPKDSKKISPDSLQTPTDPDATYRYKYGNNVGYVANMKEEIKKDGVAFITDYDFKKNIHSDQEFIKEYINSKEDKTEETLLVDAAYYSDEINKKAEEKNIKLIPTQTMGKKQSNPLISEFKINEEKNEIEACPNNEKPLKTSYNEKNNKLIANFDRDKCLMCQFKDQCEKSKIIKKRVSSISFTLESFHKSKQEKIMNTEEYKKISNKRAGIEGTPSVLRRKYNVDNLPVRGLLRAKMWFGLDIMAINIKKGIAYDASINASTSMAISAFDDNNIVLSKNHIFTYLPFKIFLLKIKKEWLNSFLTKFKFAG